MSLTARLRPVGLLLIALLGCDGGPSGPSAGSLRVTVLGLPTGTAAAITVNGPGGFNQPVSASQSFTQLTPGTYTIAATTVSAGGATYDPSPPSQTVTVTGTQATASVFYSQATGSLTVNITGLGTSRTAVVTVTGPGGYSQVINATTTLAGLDPGDYIITADNASAIGCATHTPTPPTQNATIVARNTSTVTVTYDAPPNDGSVNLCIAGMYLTQSVQDLGGTVPLVQNRDGYLRVFVVADRANTVAPSVQVRFYNGAVLLSTVTIPPSGLSVPTAIDESSLGFSWDTTVSGGLIQPGFAIQAEVNPPGPGAITETDPNDNLYPAAGPLSYTVRNVPPLDVTFVPVRQSGNGLQGRITAANKDSFLITTQKMHPIDTFNAALHAAYTTTTQLILQANNANGAWGTILGEIDALRVTEHSPRYYYGVARVTYSSGVAGVAYVSVSGTTPGSGQRAALGWDYLMSGSIVAAHELGHNWGRNHAPCGGPAGIDPQYPQPDGSTGTYGMDIATKTLEPSTLSDIMGYCDPKWISDYTYRGVMNYLLAPSPPVLSVVGSVVQNCLLVWGHIRDGQIVLEPAFQVNTRPSLPSRRGPYSLEGRDGNGNSVFALSFAPTPVADAPNNQENFVFAVPVSSASAARLASIRVAGQGRQATLTEAAAKVAQPGGVARPEFVAARRVAGDRVTLRWDGQSHPMVMVRDPDTGEVLSFGRGGEVELSTAKGSVDLIMSSGVRSQVRRMRVAP